MPTTDRRIFYVAIYGLIIKTYLLHKKYLIEMPNFVMIYSTFGNQESAEKAAKKLLEKHLIACAMFFPGNSIYWWKGQLEQAQETVLLAKTPKSMAVKARTELEKIHPYETPCILTIPVDANSAYLNWATIETKTKSKKK
jgi:periplasmic divalent cation tolerance protein